MGVRNLSALMAWDTPSNETSDVVKPDNSSSEPDPVET